MNASRLRLSQLLWPVVLAFFQVSGTIGAGTNQPERRGVDALALLIAVAGPLSLIAVKRRPREVMGFVATISLIYLARDYAYGPVFATLAIATVFTVVRGHRSTAWLGLGTVVAGAFALRATLADEPWSWEWFSGVLAWSLLVLAIAEVIRIRRERISAARRARRESTRRRANEERLQIARELHDVVAHHISLINVQAGVALHIVDRRPEQARTALEAIKDASKEALVELRSLVGVLREEGEAAPRAPTGSLATLDDLVERTSYAGLAVRKSVEGQVRPLPAAVELAAVRIVQEAITNVVRHAGDHTADIIIRYDPGEVAVTVQDDGRGMVGNGSDGTGVTGMRERAEALGGSLDLGTGRAGGVRVRARLPMRDDS